MKTIQISMKPNIFLRTKDEAGSGVGAARKRRGAGARGGGGPGRGPRGGARGGQGGGQGGAEGGGQRGGGGGKTLFGLWGGTSPGKRPPKHSGAGFRVFSSRGGSWGSPCKYKAPRKWS